MGYLKIKSWYVHGIIPKKLLFFKYRLEFRFSTLSALAEHTRKQYFDRAS
jgi:hypothetical protein